MTQTRHVIVDTTKSQFVVQNRIRSSRKRPTSIRVTSFDVKSNLVNIDNRNCAFCFLQYHITDDDGTSAKNDPFPMDPDAGPTFPYDTSPVRLLFLPHGIFTVTRICEMLNEMIQKHTHKMIFKATQDDFVHVDFVDRDYHPFEFVRKLQFTYTETNTGTLRYVAANHKFSINANSCLITLDKTYTTHTPIGDTVAFDNFIGFAPTSPNANYSHTNIVQTESATFVSDYGQSSTSVNTSPFPFFLRLDEEIFEVIEIVDNHTLRTRNPALNPHANVTAYHRTNSYGRNEIGHSLTLQGEKIIIPMSSMVSDICLRRFGTTFGSVLDSLGFSQHQTRNMFLMGHLTRFEYFTLCEYGLEEARYLDHNGNLVPESTISTEYTASGRYPAMERTLTLNLVNRSDNNNLNGMVEIFTAVPVKGVLKDGANQGRITALKFYATDTPVYTKYSQGLHSYTLVLDGAENPIEMQSNPSTTTFRNKLESKVSLPSEQSFARGIACIVQSELGETKKLSVANAKHTALPAQLRFKIVDRKNKIVNTESLRIRACFEIQYS